MIMINTKNNTHTVIIITYTCTHIRIVTQYETINLQELCLDKLFSYLKLGNDVDKLPLPKQLKKKLKEYF